ncbi:MAG: RNA methyltransferase [Chitinophagales bacterium]|nr:MAG: RNA methyltransferase [Chitinophagales bacterium]
MLSKAQIKYIQSLRHKKIRHTLQVYIIEGEKMVLEYLQAGHAVQQLWATASWISEYEHMLANRKIKIHQVNEAELKKISALTTPNQVLAVVSIPEPSFPTLNAGVHVALEDIQDPGNMGTIIRTADWFGIHSVLCSENCVDVYNPKVVQATMGALLRVKVFYVNLYDVLKRAGLPVYAAVTNGSILERDKLPQEAILVIGNESRGLSEKIQTVAVKKIAIPRFGKAESLNAAVAAGILMYCFKTR